MYRHTKPVERCQCCMQRGSLTDPEGTADFLRDNDSAEIVNTTNNACSFHISSLLVNGRITMLLFVKERGLYWSNKRTSFSNLFQSYPPLAIIAKFCYICYRILYCRTLRIGDYIEILYVLWQRTIGRGSILSQLWMSC